MSLLLFLLGAVGLAVMVLGGGTWVRRHALATGRLLAGVAFAGAVFALTLAAGGEALTLRGEWVGPLDIDFALALDPFRALFLTLICGTAAAILHYAAQYYRNDPRLPQFLAALLVFGASMIGIVLADDFFLFFVFWEATAILSFLLIGWYDSRESSRWKANQALLVTALGGLALLAGLILLRMASGTGSLSELAGLDLRDHPLAPAIIILVGLGALTKSAQFPFHFWLPNAMAGPTPVSAFLHSATMVKAGVFLLAIMAPILSGHPLWLPLFFTCGMLTVAAAVVGAWRETDLKAILAATTLAALGHLTILTAIGTPAALQAFLIFLIAHALYKAPLFLAAGIFEEAYQTRDVTRLRGALRFLPITGVAVALSLLSLMGVPVLPGFVAKEYFLKSTWSIDPWLAILAAASFAAVIALAVRAIAPLAARGKLEFPSQRPTTEIQLAPWLSAAAAVVLTVAFPWISSGLLSPATEALQAEGLKGLLLWPGLSVVLALSVAALLGGILVGRLAPPPVAREDHTPLFDGIYRFLFEGLGKTAKTLAATLQNHPLRIHLTIVLLASGVFVAFQLLTTGLPQPKFRFEAAATIPTILGIMIALAGVGAATARDRLELLTLLGLLGLLIALLYSFFSAPDLALTQLLTETVLIVLLVAVLRKVPACKPPSGERHPFLAFSVAVLGGAVATGLILKAKAVTLTTPVSNFFTERSLSEAYGANIVNVILVDFRALDTFGEITVLAVAAVGAAALVRRLPMPNSRATDTPLLRTALPLISTVLLVIAVAFFLRGHNNPGGGFIAALVAATAFAFAALSGPPSRFVYRDGILIVVGLTIAVGAALLALAAGKPFFTGLWIHPKLPGSESSMHFGTPLLFDLGVFLTVLGFALAFLRRFLPNRRPQKWN